MKLLYVRYLFYKTEYGVVYSFDILLLLFHIRVNVISMLFGRVRPAPIDVDLKHRERVVFTVMHHMNQ